MLRVEGHREDRRRKFKGRRGRRGGSDGDGTDHRPIRGVGKPRRFRYGTSKHVKPDRLELSVQSVDQNPARMHERTRIDNRRAALKLVARHGGMVHYRGAAPECRMTHSVRRGETRA